MPAPRPIYQPEERVQIRRARLGRAWVISNGFTNLAIRHWDQAIAVANAMAAEDYDRRLFQVVGEGRYLLGRELPPECRPDAARLRQLAEAAYA